jgi:hypothetical protein
VKYIEIGNEETLFEYDTYTAYDYYIERFNILSEAMRKVDPSLKFIHSAWWRASNPKLMQKVFTALDGKADYWDFHPWVDDLGSALSVEGELRRMEKMFKQWNPNTTMRCAIFEENGSSHGVRRMLSHVIVQNAVRRMGDFVLCTCPANALEPYLQNDNGWNQGQIFFTPSQVWGMPPYYAQQMASQNHLPLLVECNVDGAASQLDVTATRSEDGKKMVLHIANIGEKAVDAEFDLSGFGNVGEAYTLTLSAPLKDVNSPDNPTKIVPVKRALDSGEKLACKISEYSYTVLVVSK